MHHLLNSKRSPRPIWHGQSLRLFALLPLLAWTGCQRTPQDVPLVLTSGSRIEGEGFYHLDRIPVRYTVSNGANLSPPLEWTTGPGATQEWALVCVDVDAQPEPLVHWIIYGIPADMRSLPEGVDGYGPDDPYLQGPNSWGPAQLGYRGPIPPAGSGVHRYHFTLYALDARLNLEPGLNRRELLAAMDGHILAQTTLIGKFERPAGWDDYYHEPPPPAAQAPAPSVEPAPPEPNDSAAVASSHDRGPGPPEPPDDTPANSPATP